MTDMHKFEIGKEYPDITPVIMFPRITLAMSYSCADFLAGVCTLINNTTKEMYKARATVFFSREVKDGECKIYHLEYGIEMPEDYDCNGGDASRNFLNQAWVTIESAIGGHIVKNVTGKDSPEVVVMMPDDRYQDKESLKNAAIRWKMAKESYVRKNISEMSINEIYITYLIECL